MNTSTEHTTYDDRLYAQFMRGGSGSVEAVLTLMERNDPLTFEQARAMIPDPNLSPERLETIKAAWDRYFHMRSMSWD